MRQVRRSMVVALVVLLASCASSGGQNPLQGATEDPAPAGDGAGAIAIGAVNFGESIILAEMYRAALDERGIEVARVTQLESREGTFPALRNGDLDILPEYTGELLSFLQKGAVEESDPQQVTQMLREQLEGTGVVALEPSPAQDVDVLVVRPETAQMFNLQMVSDLAPVADQLVVGGPPELETRSVGLPGLQRVYGITFKEFVPTDAGGPVAVQALESGRVDAVRLFSTNPIIEERGWIVLEEDKPLTPPQNVIPVVRDEILTPEIEIALNEVSAALTTETLLNLNRRYDIEKQDADTIAQDFLREQGLIPG